MSANINCEVVAEDVVQAMLEDGVFAEEMWTEIAEALHQGMLLDNLMDHINSSGLEPATLRKIQSTFKMISDMCEDRLETM